MKRIALLLLILLLPLFAAAGFYGYLWWRVHDLSDRMVAQASPFLELSYEGVRVDLVATEVGLQGLRIAPMGGGDQFRIEEVVLKSTDWVQMMRLDGDLQQGSWPEALSLRFSGLVFHLDGPMTQQWMGLQPLQPHDAMLLGRFCSAQQGAELMQAMGIRMINLNMAMGYRFDPSGRHLIFDIEADADQLNNFSFEMVLETPEAELSARSMAVGTYLQSLSAHSRDKGFNRRYREYCAGQAGIPDEQIDPLMRQELAQMAAKFGVSLSDALAQQVASLYRPGANLSFRLQPGHPVSQFDLVAVDSLDAFMELLKPSLEVNGQAVDLAAIGAIDLEMLAKTELAGRRADQPVEKTPVQSGGVDKAESALNPVLSGHSVAVDKEAVSEAVASPVTSSAAVRKGFYPVQITDAGAHIGDRVRMVTYFGRRIEGRILEVGRGEILIEQRMQRGVATYSIALDKVAELEVYR